MMRMLYENVEQSCGRHSTCVEITSRFHEIPVMSAHDTHTITLHVQLTANGDGVFAELVGGSAGKRIIFSALSDHVAFSIL